LFTPFLLKSLLPLLCLPYHPPHSLSLHTLGHIGFTYRAIRVDGSRRALGRTDTGFRGGFAVLQQCLQVSVVHLVEEVNGGFLVLVGAVDQNIKVVARLGSNGDKLLMTP